MPFKNTARRTASKTVAKPDRDLYQEVTDKIVTAIEAGAGKWVMPWHTMAGAASAAGALPVNLQGRPYTGVNVPHLWAEAMIKGYSSNVWGTFDAFKARKVFVKKGEKATPVVYYGKFLPKPKPGERPEDVKPILFLKYYNVFNADQVEGFATGDVPAPTLPPAGPERIAHAEAFFAAQNIDTRNGGNRAFYVAALDYVQMPHHAQFAESSGYYGTLGHEYVHATGHRSRLDRDLSGRFKSESYAAEELIAELGAAFLCAMLGIDNEPRPDHAAYVQSWLTVLRDDKKAIFTAASMAKKAVNYMTEKAGAVIAPADAGEADPAGGDAADDMPLAA